MVIENQGSIIAGIHWDVEGRGKKAVQIVMGF